MAQTNHIRWSDSDTYWGPFTYASDKYNNLAVVLSSGDCDEHPGCRIRIAGFGHTLIIALPQIIMPWREKVFPKSWDAATIVRMGRNWYWNYDEREYGFSYGGGGSDLGGGFLQVFLGRQSNDSSTTQSWSCFTPWNNLRHVRHSLYDLEGKLFATETKRNHSLATTAGRDEFDQWIAMEDKCPSVTFSFADFDGEQLTAKTRMEERQWELGTGWFKWLRYFRKPIIHRSLDIAFSGETGKRKGSWKGGTVGHSIGMLAGELHEDAFKRYCIKHQMTYRGAV